jgi:hypothetical protein
MNAIAHQTREFRAFAPVRESSLYLRLAISRSRLLRITARGFFRLCGAVPPLRRAVFQDA